jgi:threonine/homoserine/homoserine lactone efflux protein
MSLTLAFLVAACLLAITPGPGMAYVVARTVAGGRSEGLASCLGTALGGMVHVAGTALGVSALVAQSAAAFTVVKYLGAAYLLYLGLRMLIEKSVARESAILPARGPRRAFLEGIVVEAMNVKTALFFVAFLPQFVATTGSTMVQLVWLGAVCVMLNTIVDVAVVFAADRLVYGNPVGASRGRLLTRVSGLTMIGLSAFLAFSKRQG